MRTVLPLLTACVILCAGTAFAVDIYPSADMTTTPTGAATTTAYIEICYRPAHGHPDTRGSMLFDLSPYTGWTLESAILNIDVFYRSGCGLPTSFHTYAATEEWDETWSGVHLDHGTTNWGTFTVNELAWYQLDISDLVSAWLSQSVENYGLVFESINSNQAEHRLYSVNANEPTVRPYLTLSFPMELQSTTWAAIKHLN
ncbi:MAG: DNRLRE domain-containing protein [Candidatus Aegiribacteria sp.]|nr:DNRLRE domain-containing protein [Candidatus Aegiribacteria sp.]